MAVALLNPPAISGAVASLSWAIAALPSSTTLIGAALLAWWPTVTEALSATVFGLNNVTMEVGDELFFLEKVDDAAQIYSALLEQDPTDFEKAELYIRLGNVADSKEDPEGAITLYDRALALVTENEASYAHAHFNRALAYLGRRTEGDIERAYEGLVTAHNTYMKLSDRAIAEGEYDQAIEHLDNAFEAYTSPKIVPDDPSLPPEPNPIGGPIELGKIHLKRSKAYLYKNEPQNAFDAGKLADDFYKVFVTQGMPEQYIIYSIMSQLAMAQAVFVGEGNDELVLALYSEVADRLAFIRRRMRGDLFPDHHRETLGIDLNILERFINHMLNGGLEAIAAYRDQLAMAMQGEEQVMVYEFRPGPHARY